MTWLTHVQRDGLPGLLLALGDHLTWLTNVQRNGLPGLLHTLGNHLTWLTHVQRNGLPGLLLAMGNPVVCKIILSSFSETQKVFHRPNLNEF